MQTSDARLGSLFDQARQDAGPTPVSIVDAPPPSGPDLDPGMARIATRAPHFKPAFFGKDGLGGKIAHTLWDVSGMLGNPLAIPHMAREAADARDQRAFANWRQRHDVERQAALEDQDREDNRPRYFSGGQDYLSFDPRSRQTTTIYDAPTGAETYARNFGDPGSPEYQTALQDFTLRTWGPTAIGGKTGLNDQRYEQRRDLKGVPTYRDLHPTARPSRLPNTGNVLAGILTKAGQGQPLTPGEQQIYQSYLNRGRRGGYGGGSVPTGSPLAAPGRAPAPPPVGTVKGGHRYIGGDPANPASWQKL